MREPSALLDQSHYVNQLVHAIGVFWLPSPNLPTRGRQQKKWKIEIFGKFDMPKDTWA